MLKRRSSALAAAAALSTFLVIVPGSHAAAPLSPDNDSNNLRGRPVGGTLIGHEEAAHDDNSAPSSTFGRVLESIWNSSNEDIDAHYPLFLTNNKPTKDDFHVDDVLFSFTLSAPNSNIMSKPPGRKLAEASHAEDAAHGDGEGGHGDAHGNGMVVHVTYENIYAILVFLITATAMGIVTSKLGMVSNDM